MESMQPDATVLVAPAVDGALPIVQAVKPAQFSALTPCQEWDVRALGAHLRQVVVALDLVGRDGAVPADLWERELGADDWPARFAREADRAVATWASPAPAKDPVSLGTAEMPARFATAMLISDLVIHGWDLARATGQDYRCGDDLAALTLRFVGQSGEQGRAMGIYAPPAPVPDDGSPLDQAIALSGRDPRWSPRP